MSITIEPNKIQDCCLITGNYSATSTKGKSQEKKKNIYLCVVEETNRTMNIVFMGTPDFAVESLRALVEGGYNVVGVITMPDKPAGKHQSVLQACPVKEYALSQNLPLLQPEKLKDPDFLEQLKAWKADLQIVVAFRMLPEVVWNMPPLGTFNLHASLLPQYRGAAPVNWAVINGEKETGATTFFLAREIDTGKIIFRERIPIEDTDNAGIIRDQLMKIGAGLVIKTVDAIINREICPVEQKTIIANEETLKPAPKIFKETCRIDWCKTTKEVYDFIRGLSPYPAAWTELKTAKNESFTVKIFETGKIREQHDLIPGNIVTDGKKQLDVATSDGFIRIKNLQQTGKKRMSVEDFLSGNARLFIKN
jgi:methionyl-tRNA formyltransferase